MKAGLTQAEMDKMSLSELQKAVDKAKNKTEIEKTIADIKVLNPNATGLQRHGPFRYDSG